MYCYNRAMRNSRFVQHEDNTPCTADVRATEGNPEFLETNDACHEVLEGRRGRERQITEELHIRIP